LYTGKECEVVREMSPPAGISGSLYKGVWSPDSQLIATAGGDKKVRVWSREAGEQICEAQVGDGKLEDIQLGITWPKLDVIITVCLDSRVMIWEVGPGGSSLSLMTTIKGTTGRLDCCIFERSTATIVYGGSVGLIGFAPKDRSPYTRKVGATVTGLLAHSLEKATVSEVWVSARDDSLKLVSVETGEDVVAPVAVEETVVGMGWLDSDETKVVAVGHKGGFFCVTSSGMDWRKPDVVDRRPTAVASWPGVAGLIAVSLEKPAPIQANNFDIILYDVCDDSSEGVRERAVLKHHVHRVQALRFHPNGKLLASSDTHKNVILWDVDANVLKVSEWYAHTARVTCLDWLPGTNLLLSGSLDRHVCVWDCDNISTAPKIKLDQVHKDGVCGICGIQENQFATVGGDGFVLVHELS